MTHKEILIPGGCGFIGSNLVRFLIRNTKWNVTILDNLKTGYIKNIEGIDDSRVKFIKGDIRNKNDVEHSMKNCNYVVNLAAHTNINHSINN